jgi:hypothetical protein
MSVLKEKSPLVKGLTGLWKVRYCRNGERHVEPITFKPNQIQIDWGFVAAKAIGQGDSLYKISTMYIEYENVASPGDPVTVPTFDRSEGIEYYEDLQSSSTKDFLRVPLITNPTIGIETGFESYFTAPEGNKLTFYTQTQGTEGIHGKTFSDSVNSKIYGAALVATPVFADRTKDIIFARNYYATAEQTVKEASNQVGVTWEISFE